MTHKLPDFPSEVNSFLSAKMETATEVAISCVRIDGGYSQARLRRKRLINSGMCGCNSARMAWSHSSDGM